MINQLLGNRYLTLATVIRVRQIEMTRDEAEGPDESSIHTPAEARAFRETIAKAWPGARITWALSWLALKDQRENYIQLKELIVSYQKNYGDEITFIPGGYFANMYNTREQVNQDIHDALQMVSDLVGDGYRPKAIIAGYLSAENLKYLSEEEGIKVCQGTIWSQYAVDNGDGEGSISYPYYPSTQHFCKPAQSDDDFIDCVNLDGWTVDFLNARYASAKEINGEMCGSRQGVGPIETFIRLGHDKGLEEVLATTSSHFDKGFELNNFAWITCTWELCLVEGRKLYSYHDRNGMEGLYEWLTTIRNRWENVHCITHGEFGSLWRKEFPNNDKMNYQFMQRGSGICGSMEDTEITWYMNKDFRLALERKWETNEKSVVIDFTRYDLEAQEPKDPTEKKERVRNWSLMNKLNQKQSRPQDTPIPMENMIEEDKEIIVKKYPDLNDMFG